MLGLSVGDIRSAAEDGSFVWLDGNSLAAILVAAECQRGDISILATVSMTVIAERRCRQFLEFCPASLYEEGEQSLSVDNSRTTCNPEFS